MEPKWLITDPGETSASAATLRAVVPLIPSVAKHSMAASRIRAAVLRSSISIVPT